MLANPFPDAFGLDINDLSIKVVQLQNRSLRHHRPVYDLRIARSVNIPPGLIVDGEIENPEPIRHYIQHLLFGANSHQTPIESPWVVASLPEKKTFVKLIEIPKLAEDIFEEEVRLIAKQHVPFEDDSYYLDWEIIEEKKGTYPSTSLLLSVASKKISDIYTYLLESVGLGIVALEVEPLATARCMITAQKMYQDEARAILDIGASKTTLIIYDNNSVRFSIVLPYSGEIVTTLISQKLHLSKDEAERKKRDVGLKFQKGEDKIWTILMHSTEELVGHIQKALHFYSSHFPGANPITHITMCGGGSCLENLASVLSEKLGIVAQPGQAWKNLSTKKPLPLSNDEALPYTTAIGLALRAADNPFVNYDAI